MGVHDVDMTPLDNIVKVRIAHAEVEQTGPSPHGRNGCVNIQDRLGHGIVIFVIFVIIVILVLRVC